MAEGVAERAAERAAERVAERVAERRVEGNRCGGEGGEGEKNASNTRF